ncbi:Biopolymer transport protein ExbD [Candidatus Kryptobacter tengchongensis]|uniref:Biopolymer transport protein ExbD n=1 Tax=Kryptobacter tengchongensis TaxID=1643429 RepID=A0A656D3T1_KRYT1|nr:biopolymer transporter ExbD [Candidatus Kryptobacter tengchongensis]CUS88074.1 Biopolymer transport protein ExbD [Candidatus Kryptobacter tengchongensis]CUS96562.1 Biopolymer transport protein ExbD [Candidatus Kryptobacter tengchongensis]CUT00078.1 Biopolymer transport protein ExbD [Candidatus Kryptobacter tengchongensis]CUU06906.1 Biopolymer transport protein ExbD [Candidatus Kryptobacter tengchongensis]
MFRRRKRAEAEIPSASMADIAFELMIFFLVATTFDVDTGIGLVLPPAAETTEQVKVKQSDIAKLLVNAAGEVLLDGELITVPQIRETIKNKIKANPKLIVSIKTDRETNYSRYIEVLDELKLAYNDLREEYSLKTFGKSFKDLTKDQQEEVKKEVPIRISIAEPEEVK